MQPYSSSRKSIHSSANPAHEILTPMHNSHALTDTINKSENLCTSVGEGKTELELYDHEMLQPVNTMET
jgi:hypothetical protein